MTMKILITGATGLIGQRLIDALLINDTQCKIIALSRSSTRAKSLLPKECHIITELKNIDLSDVDAIVNLAGEPIADKRWSPAQKSKICQSRWQLTEQLSKLINSAKKPPSIFISGSAIGYYGRQDIGKIDESYQHFNPEFTHDVCAKWEELALKSQDKTRVCILRTGIVLSPRKGALAKMLPAFKLGLGGPISNGKQMMSWIHIDDMVAIILSLLKNNEASGVYNATAPTPVSNETFSRSLSKYLNRPCIFRVPKLVLTLMLGEMSDLLLYGQAVVPQRLIKSGFTFKYSNIDEAFDNLLK